MKQVNVAVGVIIKEQACYICKRPDDKHQGGLWEFPGGKIEAGESTTEALARELKEEVAIDVHNSEPLLVIEHDYGDKQVKLDIHTISDFANEPFGAEGQQGQWVNIAELDDYDFPAANKEIIKVLQTRT